MGKHLTLGCGIFAVVFALVGCRQPSSSDIPTVTRVTVSRIGLIEHSTGPANTVARDGTAYLEAVVEGMNNPPQDVNWYIADDGRLGGTRIGADGVLHVAANERLNRLTIGARSTFDMRRFGHITLYIEGEITLGTPEIRLEGSVVIWDEVSGAGGYSLRIGGIEVSGGNLGGDTRSFDLADLALVAGEHEVTLVALGVPGTSLNSPASNAVTYTVIYIDQPGLDPLPAPVISLDGLMLSWASIPGAGGYSLRIGGIEVPDLVLESGRTYIDLRDLSLSPDIHVVTLVALGIPSESLNSPASNAVLFTVTEDEPPGLPQLDAPVIWLDGAVVSWLAVPGAGGYSLRIDGIEVDEGNLVHTATSFDLVGLGLPVGAHVITLVALGVPEQSLNSPASGAITFYVIIATGITVTVTLPDLRDMAGYMDIEGPSFGMLDSEPGQIVFDSQHYNVTSVEWFLGETMVPMGTVSEDGNILTLDSRIHGNGEGTHFVTLEVVMGGIRYSRVIAFTVGL